MIDNNYLQYLYRFFNCTQNPVFCFDLDGTIVNNNTLQPDCINEIQNLKINGIRVSIATGRTYMQAKRIIDVICPNYLCVLCDGRLSFDYSRKEFYQHVSLNLRIDDLRLLKIYELSLGVVYEYYTGYVFSSFSARRLFELSFPKEVIDLCLHSENELLNSIYIAIPNREDIRQQIDLLVSDIMSPKVTIEYAGLWLKICSSEADKSIPYRNQFDSIMYFGDGENDFEMLMKSKGKIVMKKADQELMRIGGAIHLDCAIEEFLHIVNKYLEQK